MRHRDYPPLVSGDGGQIIVSIATTVQGYVKDDPGVWTGDTTPNARPSVWP